MIRGDQNIHNGLNSLGRKTKILLQRLSGPYITAPCYSEGEKGKVFPRSKVALTWYYSLVPFSSEKKLYALKIPVLLYSSTELASQGHSLPWIWMRVWAVPSRCVCTLTFNVPCFPQSPLSMIHCFLGPFPLHPIDGFQSYLNFQVLMCCSGDQSCASLSYGFTRSLLGRGRRQAEHLSGCIALLFLSITKAMILF